MESQIYSLLILFLYLALCFQGSLSGMDHYVIPFHG